MKPDRVVSSYTNPDGSVAYHIQTSDGGNYWRLEPNWSDFEDQSKKDQPQDNQSEDKKDQSEE